MLFSKTLSMKLKFLQTSSNSRLPEEFKLWNDLIRLVEFILWTCDDLSVTYTVGQTEKISENQPVFGDKSDDSKKVLIE